MNTDQSLKETSAVEVRLATSASRDLPSRLATVPGLVRAGIASWDTTTRLPIQPLSLENAYGDPTLLRDLGARGAEVASSMDVDVIVGAESAGIPLAAAVALAAERPFAFVRKADYRGHVPNEPTVRGAAVDDRRVLLVDDAVSHGTAIEGFAGRLAAAGGEVVGVFCMVDMRDVAGTVTALATSLPIESVDTYLGVLASATRHGILDAVVHDLAVDAILNRWSDTDPRWALLEPKRKHWRAAIRSGARAGGGLSAVAGDPLPLLALERVTRSKATVPATDAAVGREVGSRSNDPAVFRSERLDPVGGEARA
jgi:orotate phosphoribosyltransferase